MGKNKTPVEYRIGKGTSFMMLLLAAIIDIGTVILSLTGVGVVIDIIIDFISYPFFWLWFKTKRVKMFSKANVGKNLSSIGIESINGLDFLPMFFVGIFLVIGQSKIEDIAEHKEKEKKKATTIRQSKVNQQQKISSSGSNIIRQKRR